MGVREEILALACQYAGEAKGDPESDFLGAFALEGADADEFLEDYLVKFDVDMSEFLYEFHYIGDEPPYHRRVVPVGVDGQEIPFLPITLDQLAHAVAIGRWQYDYPKHTIRYSLFSRLLPYLLVGWVVAAAAGLIWLEWPLI